ncbi:hypothetical protein QWY16_11590 [Planococcus shenhongbingii]|uniref:hypothetical protein n=1 Tax=Planococcus shenhongbingii TaxID=3058398 RepID=UPI002631E9E0|nr:hypothetical protein [Planococcus sp. N016]WKA57143.1 hypothetical protein QWY16_11590 [Planococcus sp. N016]
MKAKWDLPEELKGMEILETLISPVNMDMGVMIVGEDYFEGAKQSIVRFYLITIKEDECYIDDELQAFAFPNFNSAKKFAEDAPTMSAIDLMLLMNGSLTNDINSNFVQ